MVANTSSRTRGSFGAHSPARLRGTRRWTGSMRRSCPAWGPGARWGPLASTSEGQSRWISADGDTVALLDGPAKRWQSGRRTWRQLVDVAEFSRRVAKSVLAKDEQRLRELLRPACDILRAEVAPGVGRSRFGGAPDRPLGTKWPEHRLGPYRFVGQLNLEQITPPVPELPPNGLLSLFVAEDPDGEFFWGDDGYIHAEYYSPSGPVLMPQAAPDVVCLGCQVGATFRPTIDLPFDKFQLGDCRLDENLRDSYDALRDSLHQSGDYLLGYPSHRSLAYDPCPGPEWVPLITLASDDELEWCWHDGDKLMVFIERARLAALDFSNLRADAG